MKEKSFNRLAAWSAVLVGVAGLAYAVSFVVLQDAGHSALFLMLGGLFAAVVSVALYQRLQKTQAAYALLAFVFSAGAAAGAIIHGGYDLSNALNPPATVNLDLPNSVDPRGLLTFGVAAVGMFFISQLISHTKGYPKGLSTLGYVSAALMAILYVGRLVILQATNPVIVVPALLEGFIVNPIWYFWLGRTWLRAK